MELTEIIEKLNNGTTRKEIADVIGKSESYITRLISKSIYQYDNKTKQYFAAASNPGIQEENKQENKEPIKTENKPSNKQAKKEKRMMVEQEENKPSIQEEKKQKKKVTYEIDDSLHWDLRMQAFKEKRNVSELVEKAIRDYLNQ